MWVPPATMLRDLVLLDPDGERLVFGMRAHPDSAALLTRADDLEELIGFAARQRSASGPQSLPSVGSHVAIELHP